MAAPTLLALNLANTSLTGPLPALDQSAALQFLNVADNSLTGALASLLVRPPLLCC